MDLRAYQRSAIGAIEQAVSEGDRSLLAVMATGLGKTVTFATWICEARAGRSLILVHRDELVAQTIEKLRLIDPKADVGVVKGKLDGISAPIVVASVQTLAREERRDRLVQSGTFDRVVVDEAHHVVESNTWGAVLRDLRAGEEDGPVLTGWTATPARADGQGLTMFKRVVCSLDLRWGIASRWLSDIRARVIDLDGFELSRITKSGGDFAAGSAGQELIRCDAASRVVRSWIEIGEDRQTIVFVPTVEVAHIVARVALGNGGSQRQRSTAERRSRNADRSSAGTSPGISEWSSTVGSSRKDSTLRRLAVSLSVGRREARACGCKWSAEGPGSIRPRPIYSSSTS